jgi:hypothetical protein
MSARNLHQLGLNDERVETGRAISTRPDLRISR